MAKPLAILCSPKGYLYIGKGAGKFFAIIKEGAINALLGHVDYTKETIIRIDASTVGIDGVLFQFNDRNIEE